MLIFGRCVALCALACCFVQPQVAAASSSQVSPGAVSGQVLDFDGTPLPGIDVEIVGPFPANTARTTVSDGEARFSFTGLAPGRYRVALVLPDVTSRSDADVTVNAGQTTQTVLILSLQGTSVNVVVQAEAPPREDVDLADIESTSGLRIFPGTQIENLPLPAEQALDVLPFLPTVVRGPDDELSIDGTMPTDSVLLFNGIDLTDPYSGAHDVRLPIEAIDSVDLIAGVPQATYGDVAGGIVDVTTVAGGDSWDWGLSSPLPAPRFKDGTIQGIKRATPRVNVSGPLKAGETYVSLAGEYDFDRVRVYDVPGDPDQDHVRTQGWDAFAQVNWDPSQAHNFTFGGLVFPSNDKFVGLNGLTPPEATLNVDRDNAAMFTRYRYRQDENRSLDLLVQYNRIGLNTEAQGADPYQVLTGGYGGNNFHIAERDTSHFLGQVIQRRRFFGDRGNSHVLQFGGNFERLRLDGVQRDGTILVLGAQQQLLQRIDVARESTLSQDKLEWSLFVQDRWTHSERFWVDLGLRYSSDSYTKDQRFAPRFGAAWDPVGDRKTLLKFGAGIIYRRVYLGEMAWEQLPARLETTALGDGTALLQTLVPTIAGDELDAPRTVQFTADVSHRLDSGWIFRGGFSRRQTSDNIVVDRDDGSGVVVGPLANLLVPPGQFETPGTGGQLLLSNDGEATAWSIEATIARRIPTGGEFVLSYVRSRSFGDLNDFTILTSEFPEAIIRPNVRALRRFDSPHRILAWATFEAPREILITPAVEWRSGFPYSVLAENQAYLGAPNSERFPNFFALDIQATKAFEIKGYRIIAGLKVTNITSHDNPRQVVANIADPDFGDFRNSVPVRVRGVFNIRF